MTVPSLRTALGPFPLGCMAFALQAKDRENEAGPDSGCFLTGPDQEESNDAAPGPCTPLPTGSS